MPPFSTTIFHFSFFVAIYESILSTMPTNIFIRQEFVICQVQKVPQITCSRYIAQFVIKKTVSSYQLIWVPNFLVIYNIQNSKENTSLMNYSKQKCMNNLYLWIISFNFPSYPVIFFHIFAFIAIRFWLKVASGPVPLRVSWYFGTQTVMLEYWSK